LNLSAVFVGVNILVSHSCRNSSKIIGDNIRTDRHNLTLCVHFIQSWQITHNKIHTQAYQSVCRTV